MEYFVQLKSLPVQLCVGVSGLSPAPQWKCRGLFPWYLIGWGFSLGCPSAVRCPVPNCACSRPPLAGSVLCRCFAVLSNSGCAARGSADASSPPCHPAEAKPEAGLSVPCVPWWPALAVVWDSQELSAVALALSLRVPAGTAPGRRRRGDSGAG